MEYYSRRNVGITNSRRNAEHHARRGGNIGQEGNTSPLRAQSRKRWKIEKIWKMKRGQGSSCWVDTIFSVPEKMFGIQLLFGQGWGPSGAGAMLPLWNKERKERVVAATDLGNGTAFGIDVYLVIAGLALAVIAQTPPRGKGTSWGCGDVCCT